MSLSDLDRLADRLRWDAAVGTVSGSLPVLFFGQLARATVVSVGINPSKQEFLSTKGVELDGPLRRFETLKSLGITDRRDVDDERAPRAVATMSAYFEPGKPIYSWFRPLERVLNGFGVSLVEGTAAHLDLVQEATDPVWSGLRKLDPVAADQLLARDLKFLKWQIDTFPIESIICTSALVLRNVLAMVSGRVVAEGQLARVKWTVAVGAAGGRRVGIAGWNLPLMRPTGLTNETQVTLGSMLKVQLQSEAR